YRRSEQSWREAGALAAELRLAAGQDTLDLELSVHKPTPRFSASAENPLDNEHADINSDGVQLHLALPPATEGDEVRPYSWLIVPETDSSRARVTPRLVGGPPIPLDATW